MFGNNDPLLKQRAFPPSNPTSVIEISEKEAWWERASLKNDNREGNVSSTHLFQGQMDQKLDSAFSIKLYAHVVKRFDSMRPSGSAC